MSTAKSPKAVRTIAVDATIEALRTTADEFRLAVDMDTRTLTEAIHKEYATAGKRAASRHKIKNPKVTETPYISFGHRRGTDPPQLGIMEEVTMEAKGVPNFQVKVRIGGRAEFNRRLRALHVRHQRLARLPRADGHLAHWRRLAFRDLMDYDPELARKITRWVESAEAARREKTSVR